MRAVGIFVVLLLVGCARGGLPPLTANDIAVMTSSTARIRAACNKAEYQVILAKSPCGEISFAQMADSSKITEAEKELFIKFATEFDAASAEQIAFLYRRGHLGDTKSLVGAVQWEYTLQQTQRAALDLVGQKVTWGEFVTRRKAISVESKSLVPTPAAPPQGASKPVVDSCMLAKSNAYLKPSGGSFAVAQQNADAAYAACKAGLPAPQTQTRCTKNGNQVDCYSY